MCPCKCCAQSAILLDWNRGRGPCAGVRRAPLLPVPGEQDTEWPGGTDTGWRDRDGDWDQDWRRYEDPR